MIMGGGAAAFRRHDFWRMDGVIFLATLIWMLMAMIMPFCFVTVTVTSGGGGGGMVIDNKVMAKKWLRNWLSCWARNAPTEKKI